MFLLICEKLTLKDPLQEDGFNPILFHDSFRTAIYVSDPQPLGFAEFCVLLQR
jgi:hypothetical protein